MQALGISSASIWGTSKNWLMNPRVHSTSSGLWQTITLLAGRPWVLGSTRGLGSSQFCIWGIHQIDELQFNRMSLPCTHGEHTNLSLQEWVSLMWRVILWDLEPSQPSIQETAPHAIVLGLPPGTLMERAHSCQHWCIQKDSMGAEAVPALHTSDHPAPSPLHMGNCHSPQSTLLSPS